MTIVKNVECCMIEPVQMTDDGEFGWCHRDGWQYMIDVCEDCDELARWCECDELASEVDDIEAEMREYGVRSIG